MYKPIFTSQNSDISKNAYINWRMEEHDRIHNMLVLSDAYYEATRMIAVSILEDNSGNRADALVFPMLFSLNQFLELGLKALQQMLNILLESNETFDGGHDLVNIYGEFKSQLCKFERAHPNCKGNPQELKDLMSSVSDYINEIKEKLSPSSRRSMDFTRYPVTRDKRTAQYYVTLEGNETIDIEYFLERIDQMQFGLRSMSTHLGDMVDYVLDYRASGC